MFNNSTIPDMDKNRLVANDDPFFIIAMTLALFALISTLFSLWFLHSYLKKLHAIIKLILTILCGYNLICCTMTCIIMDYFRITGRQTITLCGQRPSMDWKRDLRTKMDTISFSVFGPRLAVGKGHWNGGKDT